MVSPLQSTIKPIIVVVDVIVVVVVVLSLETLYTVWLGNSLVKLQATTGLYIRLANFRYFRQLWAV